MPDGSVVFPTFAGGEISPKLAGRVDLQGYYNALTACENLIPTPYGTLMRRGGFRFVNEVKDSSKLTRPLPFEVSTIQAYVIEAGNQYFRFYRDKGVIATGGPPTPVEIATPWLEADLDQIAYAQSADTLYLVHPSYKPRQLTRTSHTSWTLATVAFVDGPYFAENTTATTLTPSATSGNGITITASATTGINDGQGFLATDVGRLVRIKHSSTWGYAEIVGHTSTTQVTADVKSNFGGTTAQASWRLGLWSDTTGYPAAVTFHQERLFFGGGVATAPSRIDASVTADFLNFTPGTNDADPLSYNIGSNQVNNVLWLASAQDLIVGTLGAEFRLASDGVSSALTPSNVQVFNVTRHGSPKDGPRLLPLIFGSVVLFVQRHRRKVRELVPDIQLNSGYKAPDLTRLAEHITHLGARDEDGGLRQWVYQQEPWSVVWSARNDGMLVGFTYQRDEQVTAWHRHPVGGVFGNGEHAVVESVTSIPGPARDELWAVVKRTVNGSTKRFMEVLEEPIGHHDPIENAFYVDSGLTLDNTQSVTLTPGATTGSGVTFTAGGAVFSSGDIGRFIRHRYAAGTDKNGLRVWKTAVAEITAFTSSTEVTCTIHQDFPSTAAIPGADWRLTVTTVSGLDHLEGETVQILGDGAVLDAQTVSSGSVTLNSASATVHAGLKYRWRARSVRAELQSRRGGGSQTRRQRIIRLAVRFLRTVGASIGRDSTSLEPVPFRDQDDMMDAAVPAFTGDKDLSFPGQYSREGIFEMQGEDPTPAEVALVRIDLETEE